jgi:hypothetical protein
MLLSFREKRIYSAQLLGFTIMFIPVFVSASSEYPEARHPFAFRLSSVENRLQVPDAVVAVEIIPDVSFAFRPEVPTFVEK